MKMILVLMFTLLHTICLAQVVDIYKSTYPFEIDGVLEEEWQAFSSVKDFSLNFPNNDAKPFAETEVRITYDQEYLYVAAIMFSPENFTDYSIQSLKRDFNLLKNDAFLITIDTYSDFTNGYYFEVTPYGNQGDLLASNSGRFGGVKSSWDTKWKSSVKKDNEKWVAEIAIPFNILIFDAQNKSWRMNFIRIDNTNNEYSSWAEVPRNFDIWDLNFTGTVNWVDKLPTVKSNPIVIPSISTIYSDDRITGKEDFNIKPSLDLKLNVGTSFNLDATFNPDFSQTEEDQQQLNIGRFELFFPEKRQFFLENEDLFSSFGFIPVRPFFSRRIGLSFDPSTGTFKEVPILGGVKLSGKTPNGLRIGLMTAQTGREENFFNSGGNEALKPLPSANYTVASVQQDVFERSSLKFLFVNKQLAEKNTEINNYNRVVGTQFNFTNKKGTYYGWVFGSRSFSPDKKKQDYAYGSSMVYNTKKILVLLSGRQVMKNYNAETGFVPRADIIEIFINPAYRIYPKSILAENRVGIRSTYFFDGALKSIDRRIGIYNVSSFKSGHSFEFQYNTDYTLLRSGFDPSRSNGLELLAGTDYRYNYITANFEPSQRSMFWIELSGRAGQFFNGKRYELGGTANYRIQPFVNFSVFLNRVNVSLPNPYSSSDFSIVAPRIEASLNKAVFITLAAQYNEQFDNLNTNFRFQWRFQEVSSVHLIYVNNSVPESFQVKGQSVSLKLIYWL